MREAKCPVDSSSSNDREAIGGASRFQQQDKPQQSQKLHQQYQQLQHNQQRQQYQQQNLNQHQLQQQQLRQNYQEDQQQHHQDQREYQSHQQFQQYQLQQHQHQQHQYQQHQYQQHQYQQHQCPQPQYQQQNPFQQQPQQQQKSFQNNQRGNHLLSDICRYLEVTPDGRKSSSSRENVELGLEIEINESLKRVLTTPNSGSDELLDVTIIRPSESDVTHETTVALNKEEVRDFITLVEQHHQNKLKNNVKLKKPANVDNQQQQPVKNYQTVNKLQTTDKHHFMKDDVPDHIPANKQPKSTKDTTKNTAERATKNTVEELQKGASTKSQKSENPQGTPCVCQHCGIMGVLVQSNKTQIGDLTNTVKKEEKKPQRENKGEQHQRRRSPDSKQKDQKIIEIASAKSVDQIELLREINARIKNLEKRIAVQEETAVPRDYLKHVLHKILAQYKAQNEKEQQQPQQQKIHNTKNTGTQYVETRERYPAKYRKDSKGKHYQIHTLLHTTTAPTSPTPKTSLKAPSTRLDCGETSTTSNNTPSEEIIGEPSPTVQTTIKQPLYFWGEEVVKPGCDLKTKILDLLEETIGKIENPQAEGFKPLPQSKIPVALPEKLSKFDQHEIKVERDDNLLFLGRVDELTPCNIDDYVQRNKTPEVIKPQMDKNANKPFNAISNVVEDLKSKQTQQRLASKIATTVKGTKNSLRNMLNPPRPHYPFDPKRTLDDSTFRKNIEAQKEKVKEKPNGEQLLKTYPTQSATTESKASMEYVLQKLRNEKLFDPGLKQSTKEEEGQFKTNPYARLAGSIIRENMTAGFRNRKLTKDSDDVLSVPVDVTYVNPKITHWSEESTASEDKYMKYFKANDRRDTMLPVETKESLIYKLEFLKNLAKHKSADQSKVLNKIWTQAKKTAKSKNDAVFIKIPFKSVNTVEPRNNVIEMQLTLEQLETVVKSVKVNEPTGGGIPNYKSSSEIDIGQRRHEEIRRANMEVLNRRRHLSAKTNRNKK